MAQAVCWFANKKIFLRSHLDTSAELRFSLGSLAETQSDHYRSAKVIRRPRRGRMGLRETKVSNRVLKLVDRTVLIKRRWALEIYGEP